MISNLDGYLYPRAWLQPTRPHPQSAGSMDGELQAIVDGLLEVPVFLSSFTIDKVKASN